MNDTALPPGCAKLHVTDDPKTWSNKVYVVRDERWPARIISTGAAGAYPLIVLRREGNGYETPMSFTNEGRLFVHDSIRLYDAAPEPVKPREWWALREKSVPDTHRPYMLRATRAEVEAEMTHGIGERLVRLIEAPVEGGGK